MSKQEIMYSHVEDWQASGLTQSKYCESVGIKLATFSYWVVKFKGETEQEGSSNFIAISKASKTEGKQYEIVYPNGVKLRLETKDLSELYSLVNLV
ncbi:IS66 family insertion sequence element accessory protein TnpA [Myroides odoratimimus]|uniref:IS66 family insertion sequence element accessory protein TnpA n=1 Tax=Myroides odoratimimus TaxID=76832 RepID=UPI001CE12FD9|nr:IS66 family insertion sequence element accessory protein TnpB [Myroides odoratimimus]MCA4807331.1 IS66 family insertion sequence element accessory protein TnpB [Myroides odoratimimus]MCO7724794.1 IS66 family insertion sequence element accessory protein TnpB [Myroides odoratimimus]MDM1402432.1 IS66 family insertion sequence element accessory protein TnpB [Myroides odoratimimus]MDM1454731.1 IS66 family insertion sequence element accessory protein TnpB [Myroides odoratimimus]MDM1465191.1 IS66 